MRSWLYVPGNSPKKIVQAGIYGADGLVFDLEDAVAPNKKTEARFLLSEALKTLEFNSTVAVRINGLETIWWQDDTAAVIEAGIHRIRLPKVEVPGQVERVLKKIEQLENYWNLAPGTVKIQCILETPEGVEQAFTIAGLSSRVEALSFGAEDYCTAMGIMRTGPAFALDYARSRIANAAAARGIMAIDTVWANYRDYEGLEAEALRSRQLGFRGKSVIHPDQIEPVNRIYSPSEEEIAWARNIAKNADTAVDGVCGINGSMVDSPVIRRAKSILTGQKEQ